jgi:hypothetical protein
VRSSAHHAYRPREQNAIRLRDNVDQDDEAGALPRMSVPYDQVGRFLYALCSACGLPKLQHLPRTHAALVTHPEQRFEPAVVARLEAVALQSIDLCCPKNSWRCRLLLRACGLSLIWCLSLSEWVLTPLRLGVTMHPHRTPALLMQ